MPRLFEMDLQLFNEEGATEVVTEQSTETQEVATESTEVSTENVEQATDDAEEQTQPSLLDTFEYPYMKESQKVKNMEELQELAELGRYYKDKGKEKLASYDNDPRIKLIERLASENNMPVDQYLEAVDKQRENDKIQAIATERQVPVEVANDLYQKVKLEERVQKESNERQLTANDDADLAKFVEKYPDVKELPQEVTDAWIPGTKLTEIYKDYEFNQMKAKITEYESKANIQNQNLENSEASTGSVTGNGVVTGGLTEAMIDSMSPKELMKRWPEVKKLTGMK